MTCENCGTCEVCGNRKVEDHNPSKHLEHKYKKFWRPIAAYIYLSICIFDFMVAPVWIEQTNETVNTAAFAEIRKFSEKDVQMRALDNVDLGNRSWSPVTLQGGGLFHLAFGAILGAAAFTRGQEKVAAIKMAPKLRNL